MNQLEFKLKTSSINHHALWHLIVQMFRFIFVLWNLFKLEKPASGHKLLFLEIEGWYDVVCE